MRRPTGWEVVAALLGLGALGSFCVWSCGLPPIPPHRGDGEFRDISHRAGPFPLRGYTVSMPEFDLGQPLEAEYRVAGLAEIGPECGVHLAIRGFNGSGNGLGGELRLELIDSKERAVVSVAGKLGDYTWWGFNDVNVLYQSGKSFFRPDPQESYRIRFSYTPDPRLAGQKGFVYLRCGGNM